MGSDIATLNPSAVPDFEPRESMVSNAARSVRARAGNKTNTALPESSAGMIANLFHSYAPLAYMLPFEALDYIELLSAYNADFSQAVDNIKTLANSGHNLFIDASAPRTSQRVKERLEEKSRTIRFREGGIDGLIDQLLDDAAVYGAMCGEWVVNDDMSDVVDFLRVNPKRIRFFWCEDINDWGPFQKATMIQQEKAKENGQEVRNGCVRLNEQTFHYFCFDSAPGSPYGTPPFLAALQNIAIQRDMVQNMAQIVKKVGLLGIIDLSVKSLQPRPGETDAEFSARAGNFLEEYVTVVEEMVRDGGVIHFDDVEAKTYNITGNAAGATNIFKQNEELIFSGLKSMPSVQGRSYSTTETYAGVAYDIIIRNTYKYQRAVKRMVESGYWLMVLLWGETPNAIRLEFNSNKSLHRLQDAQAFRLEIFNALVLWVTGVITQDDFAQLLGYQAPKTVYALPPDSPLLGSMPTVGIGAKSAGGSDTSPALVSESSKQVLAAIEELISLVSDMEIAGQSTKAAG